MLTQEEWRSRCEAELGKPYLWGGEGPEGYDCSGFAQWALSLLNLDPPGDQTAAGLHRFFKQGRSVPVPLGREELGDLVFFGSEESVTHVALAWGGGEMLEAGGGGLTTTSIAIAHQQGAQVRKKRIDSRRDGVEILRPTSLAWAAAGSLEGAAGWGRFENGPPLVEWLPDGRHMRLKRPFAYIQESGRDWKVPEETVVDGASIPRVFWSLIGGPFEGPYRDASIVHDHYCDMKTRTWEDTHRIFYEGMLCSGVPSTKAKVMYYAVYRFGPRWTLGPSPQVSGFEAAAAEPSVPAPLQVESFDAASFAEDAERIQEEDPSVDEIEGLARARAGEASVSGGAQAPQVGGLAAEADAALARRPIVQRLVELQDSAASPAEAEAAGALLRRYTEQERAEADVLELEAAPSFDELKPRYEALYATCQIRLERKGEVAWYRSRLLQYRPRYESVAQQTSVPWWFIAVVHALECSFDFSSHLHNGDPLAGRTTRVPKGRPPVWNPPNDWASSAVDALQYDGLTKVKDWSLAAVLYRWEGYNGYGYYPRGIHSPYLWSFSTNYTKGKFVKDGVYDPNAVSKQCGAAVMLRALEEAGVVKP